MARTVGLGLVIAKFITHKFKTQSHCKANDEQDGSN